MTTTTSAPHTDPVPDSAAADASASGPQLTRSALGGFFWLTAGNGVRAVLKIVVLAVLGRLLLPADFGVVAAAGVVVWFSMIFSTLGVGPALVQRQELEPRHVATGLTSSVALGVLVGALVLLLAPQVAALFRLPEMTPVLRGLAVAFPIAGAAVVAECLLQRALRFRDIAAAELLSYAVGYGIVGIGMALAGHGVWALVGAELVKTTLKSAWLLRATPEARRPGFDGRAFRELLGFGAGYSANNVSIYLAAQGDAFVVARFLGAASLGLYGRAYELMLVPAQALGMVLEKVLFPTMARVQDDPDKLRSAYRRSTALVATLVLPMAVITAVLAPEIIRLLLGPGWGGAVPVLQVLAIGMYFRVGYMVGQSVAASTGAVHQAAWRTALFALLVLAGALVGYRWGVTGVAAGVVSAVLANFVMVLQLGVRLTDASWGELVAVHLPALSLAAVLGLAAWGTATLLRGLDAPALVTLLVAGAATLPVLFLLLRIAPGRVLGPDGIWIVETLCDHAPAPVRPALRAALARPAPADLSDPSTAR